MSRLMKRSRKLAIVLAAVLVCMGVFGTQTGAAQTATIGTVSVVHSMVSKSVVLNKSSLSLNKGSSYQLKVTGGSSTTKWSSSNKAIVTVSSTGKVTAIAKGTATVTAKNGSKILTCKITVKLSNIIGNGNSKIYHTKDCGYLPKDKNRVYFNTEAAAKAAGYRICSYCKR